MITRLGNEADTELSEQYQCQQSELRSATYAAQQLVECITDRDIEFAAYRFKISATDFSF